MVDVYDYADFRPYLTAWFEHRKQRNPRLSHRWFARQVGTNDPSVLANVISGRRRLTPERLEDFVAVLELDDGRAEWFRALVDFGQADTAAERDRAWAALAEIRTRRLPPAIDASRFGLLASWILPAVRELAHRADFREDPAWVAAQLDPPITAEEAASALATVERLGFLSRTPEGLRPSEPTLGTTETVDGLASYPYHRDAQALAARALQRLYDGTGPELAHNSAFLGCTLAVPEERIPEIRRELFEMQTRLMHMTDRWLADADRVVQFNISLFPVSVSKEGGDEP